MTTVIEKGTKSYCYKTSIKTSFHRDLNFSDRDERIGKVPPNCFSPVGHDKENRINRSKVVVDGGQGISIRRYSTRQLSDFACKKYIKERGDRRGLVKGRETDDILCTFT